MPAASFGSLSQLPANGDCGIKDVWNHNLHEEFQIIRQVRRFLFLKYRLTLRKYYFFIIICNLFIFAFNFVGCPKVPLGGYGH